MRYVDLQVNGAFGIDFNGDSIGANSMQQICESLAETGVVQFLPTLITDTIENLDRRMNAIAKAREESPLAKSMIPGIHLEGPYLSSEMGYIGAHPADCTRDANLDEMKQLVDSSEGLLRLVTLAPERDAGGIITRYLANQGILVSAGHTNASLDQLRCAIDSGLTCFTHLGNATPAIMPRHDNIIQRVLSMRESLHIMLIADGHHLPIFVLKNFLDLLDSAKTILVTDCVSAAGLGPGSYRLAGQEVVVGEDGACRSPRGNHFVGSAATMPMMDQILEKHLNFDSGARERLLCTNARKLLLG